MDERTVRGTRIKLLFDAFRERLTCTDDGRVLVDDCDVTDVLTDPEFVDDDLVDLALIAMGCDPWWRPVAADLN